MIRNLSKLRQISFLISVLLVCFHSWELGAVDYFDTLTAEKKPILGSDKEDKYRFRLPPFASEEYWGPHYSLNILVLYTRTNYPKFTQTSFFPLIDHLSAKENESFRSYFFPFYYAQRIQEPQSDSGVNFSLFHYNSYESRGEKISESWVSFPSFFPLFGRSKTIESGKEESFYFAVPFLFFRNRNLNDDWNHFLIFHWGEDRESSYGSILPLVYWGSGKRKFHFSFFPIFFYNTLYNSYSDKENFHLTVFPLFSYNSWDGGEEGSFLTPLFGQTWKETPQLGGGGKNEEKFSYYLLLFLNRSYHNGELQNYNANIPIVFNRKWEKGGKSDTNVLLIGGWSANEKGDYSSSYLFPLMFHKKNDYFYLFPAYFDNGTEKFGIIPPFYYSRTATDLDFYALNLYYTKDWRGSSKFLFFPLYYHSFKPDESKVMTPIFYYSSDISKTTTLFPWFLFYRHKEKEASQNYFINTYLSWNDQGKFQRGFFFPLWFYKSQEYFHFLPLWAKGNQAGNEYTWIIPLFTYWNKTRTWVGPFYSRRNEAGDQFDRWILFPFWYFYRDSWQGNKSESYTLLPIFQWNDTSEYKELITPLSYSKEYKTKFEKYSLVTLYERYDTDQESRRRVYPFYFSNSTNEYSYWNVLGLFGRGFDKAGDAKYSYAFPFYFYKRDSFRLVLPFYFRFGKDQDIYTHFGLFHYWNRSAEKDNTWIWPLLWFSNVDKVRKEEFTTWFPLYWNWDNPRSKGDMFLPLWLNYYEADKSLELKLAYSSSKTLGSFTSSATGSIGANEKDYYLDADISLFYNLFSISSRTSVGKEEVQFWKETHPAESSSKIILEQVQENNSQQKDGLGQYNRLTRDKVRSFWGVSALFGIFSYEKGDDRRHFRLLPLSWFSWSEKTSDKVYAAPLFFWSRIGDESYFVLFPFYGRQEQKENFQESYLLLGFLRGKQGEVRDYSVLWPFTRLYFSPDAWGFRIFPLVAHDQSKDHSRTISPLYYRKRIVEGTTTTRSFHSLLLPLFHSGSESSQNQDLFQEKSYHLLIPIYLSFGSKVQSSSGDSYESNFYTLLSAYSSKKELNGGESTSLFTPFYYSNRSKGAGETSEQSTKVDFLPIPGFYWKRNLSESKFFLLGYYSESSASVSKGNFLGLVSSSTERNGDRVSNRFHIFPFYFSGSEKEGEKVVESYTTVPILYYGYNKGNGSGWNVLGILNGSGSDQESSFAIYPFYSNREKNVPNFYKERVTWGLLYYSGRTEFQEGSWNSFNANPIGIFSSSGSKGLETSSSFYFLPIPMLYSFSEKQNSENREYFKRDVTFLKLIDYSKYETVSSKEGSTEKVVDQWRDFTAFFLFSNTLHTVKDLKKEETTSSYFKSYLFPVYRFESENDPFKKEKHLNFLLITDYKSGNSGLERLVIGPAFYLNNSSRTAFGLAPLAFTWKENDSILWFFLGAYGYKDKDWSRWGFAGVFDTYYESAYKRRNLNFFLGLIHTELEDQRTKVAVFGGLLGGYERRPDYSDTNFLWLRWKSVPGETLANFLPVYYYHSDPAGTATLIPPILGYFSSEKDGRFDMLGLGLLYYRNQKISKEEDLMLVGPGLFYYKQYGNSMNGLHAMGILAIPIMGGLLWDWEYETKTKYSKYSILNLLYSHTITKDGKEIDRVLGIKL
ncbi:MULTISPECIES: hypothetical protein [unclassified Leptospira]|uniref:LA_1737 family protein n=1 Tax=unclassified Leptospira TaxID=2633828 RepID=UPI0002BE65BE|nr:MULTISPECIES: hypothetical protein [unclassified Leptospira]EMJ98517.1 hypothetical protein LEP1GSC192_0261 [Leptospira sp. B5-022]MCR1792704.1 hypothetical protein [Leptospira sp. id769339]